MPIYTPRGLKIRVAPAHAFALMARRYPKIDAFSVLKTTEGIEQSPASVALIVGLACFALGVDPWQVGLFVFLASITVSTMMLKGLFIVPSIVSLGVGYSYVSGFGLLLILVVIAGYFLSGWETVFAFFVGKFAASGLACLLEFQEAKRYQKELGHPLTGSEVSFFNAYRLHADKLGVSSDLAITDEEEKEEFWGAVFADLATKYPEVVARFSAD